MIYFDANAAARVRPVAIEAMKELYDEATPARNPSSVHGAGRVSRQRLNRARKALEHIVALDRTLTGQVIFTSGGTEACNNMLLSCLGESSNLIRNPAHLVVSALEHEAVLEPAHYLASLGWETTTVGCEADGIVSVDAILAAVRKDTQLVALMAANNITGAVQPISSLASMLRENGYTGLIVSDWTQALGKTTLSIQEAFDAGVNAVALSGHKIGAPAGIGALVLNTDETMCRPFAPLLMGGPHEGGLRPGTENLTGIVAFGAVVEYLAPVIDTEVVRMSALREELSRRLELIPGTERITPRDDLTNRCVSNTLAMRFPGIRADDLVVALDLQGLAVSTGAACNSGRQEVPHVLKAMGMGDVDGGEVIRISLDWDCNPEMIDRAASIFDAVIAQIRAADDHAVNYS